MTTLSLLQSYCKNWFLSVLDPLEMEEVTQNYEMVENPTYNMVKRNFSNATTTVNAKEFSSPAISNNTNQTHSKYRLIIVLIGFHTVVALGGFAIGISACTKVSKLNIQTSASMAKMTGKKVFSLQSSISALETSLYSLSQHVLNVQYGTNDTYLEIMSITNFTGHPGKYYGND